MRCTLHQGDCLDWLPTLESNSIDSLVTDPPSGTGFMGKQWDNHSRYEPRTEKGRLVLEMGKVIGLEPWEAGFAAFTADWAAEVLRVLKPGAHGVVWTLPRTQDLTGLGLRAAGFEIRQSIHHVFGSGFPKSLNVSKAIDDFLGAERPVIGTKEQRNPYAGSDGLQFKDAPDYEGQQEAVTAPGSPEAAKWEGWGTDTKPAQEAWILIRKPLSEATVAENVLKHGVGAINVDGCRVDAKGDSLKGGHSTGSVTGKHEGWHRPWMDDPDKVSENAAAAMERTEKAEQLGRWPSNIVFTHHPDCKRVGTKKVRVYDKEHVRNNKGDTGGWSQGWPDSTTAGHADADGMETVDAWDCVEGCPICLLDEQSGPSQSRKGKPRSSDQPGNGWGMTQTGAEYEDQGGSSRFFPQFGWTTEDIETALFLYCAKAAKSERGDGCEHLFWRIVDSGIGFEPITKREWDALGREEERIYKETGKRPHLRARGNIQPTVKPEELMRWLCRLVTPPGGDVLDVFLGSGTTVKAAAAEGFGIVGCEREPLYMRIIKARSEGKQIGFDFLLAAVSN